MPHDPAIPLLYIDSFFKATSRKAEENINMDIYSKIFKSGAGGWGRPEQGRGGGAEKIFKSKSSSWEVRISK